MTTADEVKSKPELDRLEALLAEATPGPWFQGRENHRYEDPREVYTRREPEEPNSVDAYPTAYFAEDAALIVALVNAAPALIAAARERDAAVEAVRGVHRPRKSAMSTWVCVEGNGKHKCYGDSSCSGGCHFADDNATICDGDHTEWPCATERALNAATRDGDRDE